MTLSRAARLRRKIARSCGSKHRYKSLARAERAVRKYAEDFPEVKQPLNAYQCEFCGLFHVGRTLGRGNYVEPLALVELARAT